MTPKDIERFFTELDRRLGVPVQVILTGGAAAVLRGVGRATYDIDFEIHLKRASRTPSATWDAVQRALAETAEATGITPQYDEDIGRWGVIPLPSRQSDPFAVYGKVDVVLLDSGLWAIGKLTRFLSSDLSDLRVVLRKQKTHAKTMVQLWGKALGMSPPSNGQALFRRQVESFIEGYAQEIWGRRQKPEELKTLFLDTARRTARRRGRASFRLRPRM
jgi:hypothetical protein